MCEVSTHQDRLDNALWGCFWAEDILGMRDMLQQGADPNTKGQLGVPILFEAIKINWFGAVKLLLEYGPDLSVTCSGFTPETLAIFSHTSARWGRRTLARKTLLAVRKVLKQKDSHMTHRIERIPV